MEQDLIIERALVQLFSHPFLKEQLAFRGGTALHKVFLKPQARYSEDIDLIQIKKGPIKPILQVIRKQFDFLGTRRKGRDLFDIYYALVNMEVDKDKVIEAYKRYNQLLIAYQGDQAKS